MQDPWLKVAFFILLVGGIGLSSVTLKRGLDDDGRLTAARRLMWIGPSGEALGELVAVQCGAESGFRTLARDDQLWTSCRPTDGWPGGAYVAFAPERGVAEVSWPLPATLPLERTEAIQPGPNHLLAIVYRTSAAGRLVVGLAGPGGWVRPPEAVESSARVVALGLSWRNDSLELVTAASPSPEQVDGWNEPLIHTVRAGSPLRSRAVQPEALCLGEWLRCGVQAAVRQPGAAVWRFLVASREPPTLWVGVETGLRNAVRGFDYPWDARWDLDLTVTGLLVDVSLRLRGRVTREGEVQRLPEDAAAEFAGWVQDYAVERDRLVRRHQYLLGESALLLERSDETTLGVELDQGSSRTLVVYRARGVHLGAESRLGRVTPECDDLMVGSWLERADGGAWLLSLSGCVMAVSAEIERADSLGLAEHLRTVGSTCLDCDEQRLVWSFIWIVVGLPICLATGYGVVAFRRWQLLGMLPTAAWPILVLAVLTYDISAIVLVRLVLPLLT